MAHTEKQILTMVKSINRVFFTVKAISAKAKLTKKDTSYFKTDSQ